MKTTLTLLVATATLTTTGFARSHDSHRHHANSLPPFFVVASRYTPPTEAISMPKVAPIVVSISPRLPPLDPIPSGLASAVNR